MVFAFATEKDFQLWQLEKAEPSIEVQYAGIETVSNAQPLNTFSSIVVVANGIETSLSLLQPENKEADSVVIFFDSTTDCSLVQSLNADAPISLTEFGTTTD